MSPDAGPAAHLKRLRRLLAAGTLRLELDFHRLDHFDSPVAVEADSNLFVYAGIVVTGAAFWRLGWEAGLAVAAAALALYLTLGRLYVRRRIARRVEERALAESEIFRRLWRFGGVTISGDGRSCAAPEGNWMELVRSFPDPGHQSAGEGLPARGTGL